MASKLSRGSRDQRLDMDTEIRLVVFAYVAMYKSINHLISLQHNVEDSDCLTLAFL